MYYRTTNRRQVGTRNLAVPSTAYTPFTVTVPGSPTGPGGSGTGYNLSPSYFGLQNNVLDNDPFLDSDYNGVEFTANKHFADRWQMTAGLTIGANRGGVNNPNSVTGFSTTNDLNDPNNTQDADGILGYDSRVSFRISGSYLAPYDLLVSGSLVSNSGVPYVSTYSVNRTIYPSLTRSSQNVYLTSRGDERLGTVTMLDLRISRSFKFAGNRSIQPQVDMFNIANAWTVVANNALVGGSYTKPTQTLAPRIFRFGVSVNF
jgi:hypothetical protein